MERFRLLSVRRSNSHGGVVGEQQADGKVTALALLVRGRRVENDVLAEVRPHHAIAGERDDGLVDPVLTLERDGDVDVVARQFLPRLSLVATTPSPVSAWVSEVSRC